MLLANIMTTRNIFNGSCEVQHLTTLTISLFHFTPLELVPDSSLQVMVPSAILNMEQLATVVIPDLSKVLISSNHI